MTFRFFVLLVLLCAVTDVHAQAFVTQNQFVAGLVYSGKTGEVTFTKVVNGNAVVAQGAKALSLQDHSYLSIMVNGVYCTNNTVPQPTLATSMLGGASHLLKPDINLDNGTTQKIGDTIETVWHESAFDIVQDVYPVAFSNCGQIVLKVKVVNHTPSQFGTLGQYLLDVCAGANDNAYMLDQYTYEGNNTWTIYNSGAPTYYMGFETDPFALNGGTAGEGYTTDALAPGAMGLTQCSGMVFGDAKVLDTYTFGAPAAPAPSPNAIDAAVLMQWPYLNIQGNNGIDSVTQVFRTSYGTRPDSAAPAPRGKPTLAVQSRTGSFDGSLCNARFTYILATDTNAQPLGFAGATTLSATNMAQIVWAPPHAFNILPIAVHVLDSMLDGQIVLRIVGNDSSVTLDTVTYCTIPDTLKPRIHWLGFSHDPLIVDISVLDDKLWDRGLDSIAMTYTNIAIDTILPNGMNVHGLHGAGIWGHLIQPQQAGNICVTAYDLAGNRFDTCFIVAAVPPFGVTPTDQITSSLRIYPNPSTDIFTIRVGDADPGVPAQAEVLDVLGRTVARFPVAGSGTFDASALPAGTYIVRVGKETGRLIKE